MEKCSLCRAVTRILEPERRRRRMKLGFQRKSSKAPQTRKKNTNSEHYSEEENTNASISNNKVTKLFMSDDISPLKKGLNSLNAVLHVQGKGTDGSAAS